MPGANGRLAHTIAKPSTMSIAAARKRPVATGGVCEATCDGSVTSPLALRIVTGATVD